MGAYFLPLCAPSFRDENPTTRTRPVRLRAQLGDWPTAVNQTVTVFVPIGPSRDVVSVHKDAIINKRGTSMVYVVVDDKATMRTVKLGEAVGPRLEVVDGLAVGRYGGGTWQRGACVQAKLCRSKRVSESPLGVISA